ncbi:MAG: hypothetical protein AAAB35_21520 [Phyllobacterium sp.]|uniref:hypothetical protein n=1 Tax=Phyllobacterium sp. TaxID=1871046 RepID=UPI0030F04D92
MPDRHEFYRIEICGRTFTGTVHADGPYLKLLESRTFGYGAPLRSHLVLSKRAGRRYYAVYRNAEPLISLPLFLDEDLELLAGEFGIPIDDRSRHYSFARSPASQALKEWSLQHPEIARACSGITTIIPRWYQLGRRRLASL